MATDNPALTGIQSPSMYLQTAPSDGNMCERARRSHFSPHETLQWEYVRVRIKCEAACSWWPGTSKNDGAAGSLANARTKFGRGERCTRGRRQAHTAGADRRGREGRADARARGAHLHCGAQPRATGSHGRATQCSRHSRGRQAHTAGSASQSERSPGRCVRTARLAYAPGAGTRRTPTMGRAGHRHAGTAIRGRAACCHTTHARMASSSNASARACRARSARGAPTLCQANGSQV